jgi:hypothetical protein
MMADITKMHAPGEIQLELCGLRDSTYARGTKIKCVSNSSNTALALLRVDPVTFLRCTQVQTCSRVCGVGTDGAARTAVHWCDTKGMKVVQVTGRKRIFMNAHHDKCVGMKRGQYFHRTRLSQLK